MKPLRKNKQSFKLGTFAIAIAFFATGASNSVISSIPVLPLETSPLKVSTHLPGIFIFFLLRNLGYPVGSALSGLMINAIPASAFLTLCVSLLLTGICIGIFPILGELWNLLLVSFLVGILSGWIDGTGNALVLRFYRNRSELYMQAIHFCFGTGAVFTPILIYIFELLLLPVAWCIWTIAIILIIACLLNGCCSAAVTVPSLTNLRYSTKPGQLRTSKKQKPNLLNPTLPAPKSESANTPLIQKANNSEFRLGKDGYFIEPARRAKNMIIFFTAGFLFLFGGIHTSMFNWTWIWTTNIYSDNSDVKRLSAIFLSLYWGGFTVASIVLVRLQLKFSISNFKMLIVNLFGGLLVSGFLLLTRTSAQGNNELLKHPVWLWIVFPLLGWFTYGLFPAALCIPNDNRIWVSEKAKYQIMLGQSLGEIVTPLLTGSLMVLRSDLPSFVWIIFGHFLFGFIFFFVVLGYSIFSHDLADMSKIPSAKDDLI